MSTAGNKKAQGQVGSAGQTYPGRDLDRVGPEPVIADPEDVTFQVGSVVGHGDAQCLTEFARSTAESGEGGVSAIALHDGDALEWFEGADQDCRGDTGTVRDHIHAGVRPVGEVRVDVSGGPKHDVIAVGATSKRVGTGICLSLVRLNLDYASREAAGGRLVHKNLTEKIGRDL